VGFHSERHSVRTVKRGKTIVTLRPLNLETDALQYVELLNTIMPDPATVELVREWARNFPSDGIQSLMVALDENKTLVGCNEAARRPNMVPGTFFIEVIVLSVRQGPAGEDMSATPTMKRLLRKPIPAKDFKPLSRNACHAR
jgi:hypothetical protein